MRFPVRSAAPGFRAAAEAVTKQHKATGRNNQDAARFESPGDQAGRLDRTDLNRARRPRLPIRSRRKKLRLSTLHMAQMERRLSASARGISPYNRNAGPIVPASAIH